MHRKDSDTTKLANEPANSIVVNYHKHPEAGGMGHASIKSSLEGETVELSVYPKGSILSNVLGAVSFYIFPSRAENKTISNDHAGCSPIVASYEIVDDMPNHKDAHEKIKQLRENIDSGKTGFSIIPNTFTTVLHALTSPHVNATEIYTGMRVLSREKINNELEGIELTNCSHSVNQILEAGGHKKAGGIGSYPTPSGVNKLFEGRIPSNYVCETQTDSSSESRMESAFIRGFGE